MLVYDFQLLLISGNCTPTANLSNAISRVIKIELNTDRRFDYGNSHKIALHFTTPSVVTIAIV